MTNFKRTIKKIAAVGASGLMVGMTLMGASAVNYPSGWDSSTVSIVYGATAGATDMTQANSLGASLSAAVSSSTGVPITGDFIKLVKPSDNVNLRDIVSTVFGSSVTEDDLPELLADGTYSNGENTEYGYEQKITLGTGLQLNYFSDSDYNDRATTVGINLTSSQLVVNYSLDFTTDAASDVSGGDLVDIENTNINLFGKNYFISDVDNATLDITLLDSAVSTVLKEGETASLKDGGNSYDAKISFIDSTNVKLDINGELTNSLAVGQTFKLKDSSYVGVKEVLSQDYAGGIKQVEFSIGSGKLELRSGNTIKVNDDTVNEISYTATRGASTSGKTSIDKFEVAWTTDDDAFITPEQDLVMPGFSAIKFSMSDFTKGDEEETTIQAGGSDYVVMNTVLKDGAVSIPLLYANGSGEYVNTGKDASNRLIAVNDTKLVYNYTLGDRYFVASWNSSSDSESYLARFTKTSDNGNGVNVTDVQVYQDGAWQTRCGDRKIGDTCSLGSITLTVQDISSRLGGDSAINVTTSGTNFNIGYTKGGLKFYLPWTNRSDQTAAGPVAAGNGNSMAGVINISGLAAGLAGHNTNTYAMMFVEEDKNDGVALGNFFNVTLDDNSNGEVDVSGFANGKGSITDPDDSSHITSRTYSDLATFMERNGQSSDQRVVNVVYSGSESYADVFLTTSIPGGEFSESSTGTSVVTDAEVTSGKNLIVVGGPCVNSVAAELLGVPAGSCGDASGMGEGQALVKAFDRSGKLAILVAGWEAADTERAAKAFVEKADTVKKAGDTVAVAAMVDETTA